MSKRNVILIAVGVPLVAFIALLAWASFKSGGTPGGLGINREFGEVRITPKPAPDFQLTTLDGLTINLSDYKGSVVVLDFWASWCPPCRQEAPTLVSIMQEYEDRPVQIIGIDIWDNEQDARDFLSRYGVFYPNGIDQGGNIAINYGVRGIPEKFFIDADGVLQRKMVGPMEEERLRETIDLLLRQSDEAPDPMQGGSG